MRTFPFKLLALLDAITDYNSVNGISDAGKEPLSNKLRKDLLENYQVDVIPIFEKGKAVEVKFGVALRQIHNVVRYFKKFLAW